MEMMSIPKVVVALSSLVFTTLSFTKAFLGRHHIPLYAASVHRTKVVHADAAQVSSHLFSQLNDIFVVAEHALSSMLVY